MTKIKELEDDDGVLKDGQTLSVRMNMMDSASADERLRAAGVEQLLKTGTLTDEQRAAFVRLPSGTLHAPGSLAMTDADRTSREERYIKRDQKLVDAWKNIPPLDPVRRSNQEYAQNAAARLQLLPNTVSSGGVYERRDARLCSAWMNP